jgi:aspartate racemase
MKTIGLLGGMSWESSAEYYRLINEAVRDRLGGTHSAECVLYSFDFHRIEEMQEADDWDRASQALQAAGRGLAAAGAELVVICTNTMHVMADDVASASGLPLVHIADATAAAIKRDGLTRVAVLGTRYTMEGDFYTGRLAERHGLETLVPPEPDRTLIHDVIFDELVQGIVTAESRHRYVEVIERLAAAGAEGIVLGCTEIELLITADDVALPVYPTTAIHAAAAVEAALA